MELSEDDRNVVQDALGRRGLARRILVAELDAANPERAISLLGRANFLGRPVEGLVVHLDGRVGFADVGGVADPHPFPEGFPSLIAAGPPPGATLDDPKLGLRITLTFDPGQVEIQHDWTSQGISALRTSIEWDPTGGEVTWTYLETGPAWLDPSFRNFVMGLHGRASTEDELTGFQPLEDFHAVSTDAGFLAARNGAAWNLAGVRFSATRDGAPLPEGPQNEPSEGKLLLTRTGQPLIAFQHGPAPFHHRAAQSVRGAHRGTLAPPLSRGREDSRRGHGGTQRSVSAASIGSRRARVDVERHGR